MERDNSNSPTLEEMLNSVGENFDLPHDVQKIVDSSLTVWRNTRQFFPESKYVAWNFFLGDYGEVLVDDGRSFESIEHVATSPVPQEIYAACLAVKGFFVEYPDQERKIFFAEESETNATYQQMNLTGGGPREEGYYIITLTKDGKKAVAMEVPEMSSPEVAYLLESNYGGGIWATLRCYLGAPSTKEVQSVEKVWYRKQVGKLLQEILDDPEQVNNIGKKLIPDFVESFFDEIQNQGKDYIPDSWESIRMQIYTQALQTEDTNFANWCLVVDDAAICEMYEDPEIGNLVYKIIELVGPENSAKMKTVFEKMGLVSE